MMQLLIHKEPGISIIWLLRSLMQRIHRLLSDLTNAASGIQAISIEALWTPSIFVILTASYKFVPPEGYTLADVLAAAHRLRVASGAYNITDEHLADAIAELTEKKAPPSPAEA